VTATQLKVVEEEHLQKVGSVSLKDLLAFLKQTNV
jgi:hypothetical protein